jgi:putative thioredoxin
MANYTVATAGARLAGPICQPAPSLRHFAPRPIRIATAHEPQFFDVGTADFQEKVLAASQHVPVLVDFWAEWCAPCRQLKPVLEKLAAEYGGRFLLAKVNSDQNQELAGRCGVRGIPNVKAFVGGKLVDEFTGALPEAQVRAFIDRLLPSPAEPLRIAAQEARAQRRNRACPVAARRCLQADPANEAVQLDMAEIRIDAGNARCRARPARRAG